jgi:hypothetical protein
MISGGMRSPIEQDIADLRRHLDTLREKVERRLEARQPVYTGFAGPLEPILFAKASANWVGGSGGAYDTVAAHPCKDLAGTGEQTSVDLTIKILHSPGTNANVRTGEVIGYVHGGDDLICVTDALDAAVGTIRMMDKACSPVPPGWALLDGQNSMPNMMNRFPVAAGDKYALGQLGGYDKHGGDENDHDDHPDHFHAIHQTDTDDMYQGDWARKVHNDTETAAPMEHSETDNRPPWFPVTFIERIMGYVT